MYIYYETVITDSRLKIPTDRKIGFHRNIGAELLIRWIVE